MRRPFLTGIFRCRVRHSFLPLLTVLKLRMSLIACNGSFRQTSYLMRKICHAVISLILASYAFCPPVRCTEQSLQASHLSGNSTSSAEEADAGVILIPSSTGTYFASQKPRNPDRPYIMPSSRIIKIGSTYTKGRDIKELQKLLTGPTGLKIEVTTMGVHGDLSIIEPECKTESAVNPYLHYSNQPNFRARYFDLGEKDSLYPTTQALSVSSLIDDGAVLPVAGAITSHIQGYPLAYQSPEPLSRVARLPAAAEFFTTAGMFDRLDEVAKYGLDLLNDPNISFSKKQLQAITQTSVLLSRYSKSYSVNEFKVEAEKRLPIASLPKFANPDWQLRPSPYEYSVYTHRSKFCETQLALADVYPKAIQLVNNKKFSETIRCLNTEINKILESENSQTIVSMERSITPCLSDLEVLNALAKYYSEDVKGAQAQIEMAIHRIEDALGNDSPLLSKPLVWSRRIETKLGNLQKAFQISCRLSEMTPVAVSSYLTAEIINQEEVPEAYRAYSLIQDGKFNEGKEIVDAMLLRERERDEHDSLRIARFINLANKYSKTAHPKEAVELLNSLSPMLRSEELVMMRIYQLAEIALLPIGLKTKLDDHAPWKELEQTLAEVFEPGSTKFEAGYPENTEVKRQDRLRILAFAYCLNNEPEKAIKLMRHGLKEHHVERFPEPLAQMDYAFFLLKTNEFEGAKRAIDAAFKNSESLDFMPFYESLSRVADYYRQIGKTSESEELYLRAVETDKYPRQTHGYAYYLVRLADLQASMGKFDEAEKNYKLADSKPEGTTLFPDWQLRLARARQLKNSTVAPAVKHQPISEPPAVMTNEIPVPADNDNTPWAIRQRLMLHGNSKGLVSVLMQAVKAPDAAQQFSSMTHPGNVMNDLYYDMLMKSGEYSGIEVLLKQVIRLLTIISPKPGDHAVIHKGLLLKFYATRDESNRANLLANELFHNLDTKSEMTRASRIQASYPFKFIDDAADEWIKNGRYAEAEKLLRHVMAIQKKWLGSENEQQVETLTVLGKLYEKTGRGALAEQALTRAFDIVCWLHGSESVNSSSIRAEYAGVLRKNGKRAEAEAIANCRPSDEQQPMFDWDYGKDGGLRSFHSPPPKHFKDSAENQLERWLARTIKINGHIGDDTFRTLDHLVRFYQDRKRYDDAQRYLLEKLDIWNKVEGRCSINRTQVMLEIVRNQIKRGDRKSAIEWLTKAVNEESSEVSEYTTPKLFVSYALLHSELNLKAKANHEGITALNMLENRQYFPNVSDVEMVEDLTKVFARTKNTAYAQRLSPWLEKCRPFKKTMCY